MKPALRLAVSTAFAALIAAAPHAALAACSAAGTVSDVNDCTPAGGSKKTDCFVEWSISPVPPLNSKGVPTSKIKCMDNDPACDADNTPGQCTIMVGACVNVTDPRLACTASDVATFEVKKPTELNVISPNKKPLARANKRSIQLDLGDLVPTGTGNACSDERPFVVPLKKGTQRQTYEFAARVETTTGDRDSDSVKVTCLPNPNIGSQPIASARQITSSSELIGGPLAMGRIGDWLIENDRVRYIVRDVGRDFSFLLTYGGHIMDADFQRSSGPGRDHFRAMTPLINISSTDNPTSITVVNDGSAGGPAILQTSGPDDLFDPIDPAVAIKGFSTSLSIPPAAIDNNIPVNIVNEYTLNPGDDFMEIETIINNTGGSTLNLYTGDYMSGAGQSETVAPGLGFGEPAIRIGGNVANGEVAYTFQGWLGFGESQGVSYGVIPQIYDLTSSFTQSGVVVPIYGQNLVAILLAPDNNKPPGTMNIPAAGSASFKRWLALADNGMGAIVDARHKLIARGEIDDDIKTGWVQGTVTVGGQPVDGARVVIAKSPGSRTANFGLVDVFETKDGGFFQGTVPKGEYLALVKIPGYPYEGGGMDPVEHAIKIGDTPTVVDFDVPATGFVRVDVTDGVSAQPLAAKVSVIGFESSPDPGITENAILASVSANLFGYDAHEKVSIYGLPQVQFAGPSGSTSVFALQPGSYQLVISHGPEYSISRQNITVNPGTASTPQVVTASVVRVVDTTGFVSADHHVHLINSPDSVVSKDERIVTMLAEGVDYFVASDHDFKTDLTADVAALGASSLIKTAVSDEITYFDSGHFGSYPLDLVPGSVTGGAVDWGRSGVAPGLGYPSDGSYDLSVSEMAQAAKAPPHNGIVVQANHFNDGTLGYFRTSGIDTTVAPPQSSTPPANLRQNPSVTNLYSDDLTALEMWITNNRSQNALALGENLGDYINMLNRFDSTHPLLRKGIVCDSDTHSTTVVQAGGPRNMLASATDNPALVDPDALAVAVNDGRNVCTNGPFVRVSVEGDGGAIASHDLADDLIVPATLGSATVHVDVQSPTWAQYNRIDIYVNNTPTCTTTSPNYVGGVKKVCTATPNFTLTPVVSTVPVNGDNRLQSSTSQALTITQDSWVIVVVRGTDGVSKPLFPMAPQNIVAKACSGDPCKSCTTNSNCSSAFVGTCTVSNQTVAELSDGNLGQCGTLTQALANPLFIDFNGDGKYKGVTIP